jgi:hypothetical protein
MNIIVGGICRNIAPQLPTLDSFLQTLIEKIPTVRIFIYENNSTDSTKVGLEALRTKYPANLTVESEDISREELLETSKARTWDNLPCRMECIARARNALLRLIHRTVTVGDDDVVAFVDIDIEKMPTMDMLIDLLQNFPKDADAILANGLNRRGNYYDMYAIRDVEQPFGPEIIGETFWKQVRRARQIHRRTLVYSGFGGIGIYRGACIKDNSYSAIPTRDLDGLIRRMFAAGGRTIPSPATHYEGALQGIYLFGAEKGRDIFYWNNSGYNFPVVCEHSTFHARMIMRGQGRIFVEPSLIYYSTH